jgi:membrane peptidoglycan carboxypeptidase
LPTKGNFFTWLFRAAALGIGVLALIFIYFSFTLPDPNTLLQRNLAESTKILDRNGQLLYEIHGEAKRTLVTIDNINDYTKHATVAIEDKSFYQHRGISVRGIFRALLNDVLSASKSQGGSTITQQFVKNALLSKDKTWTRKLKEIILSIELEARYSKDEILQLYLNEIPYGRNAYGIEAASQTYFGVHAKDLTLAQSAYLSALPQAPTFYNPLGPNRDRLDARQQTVLQQMLEQGYITQTEKQQASEEHPTFLPLSNSMIAPHFVLYVQNILAEKYGESTLEEGGLKITTTLDKNLQAMAEKAVLDQAESNAKNYNAQNAGLVAIDP